MFINFNLMARRRDGHDAFPGVCREKTAVHRDSKAYIYLNRTKTTYRTNRSIIFLKLYRYDRDSRASRMKALTWKCFATRAIYSWNASTTFRIFSRVCVTEWNVKRYFFLQINERFSWRRNFVTSRHKSSPLLLATIIALDEYCMREIDRFSRQRMTYREPGTLKPYFFILRYSLRSSSFARVDIYGLLATHAERIGVFLLVIELSPYDRVRRCTMVVRRSFFIGYDLHAATLPEISRSPYILGQRHFTRPPILRDYTGLNLITEIRKPAMLNCFKNRPIRGNEVYLV